MSKLTAKKVEKTLPRKKEYKLHDGGGLFLRVRASGAKSWLFSFSLLNKRKLIRMTLGSIKNISLKEAREMLPNLHKLVSLGIDPRNSKAAIRTSMSDKSMAFLESITGKKMTLGNMLCSIRECKEISQADFAKQLHISRQYLRDIEKGHSTVSAKDAAEFADILGYSAMQFIRLAFQDELDRHGFHFDVEIYKQRDVT